MPKKSQKAKRKSFQDATLEAITKLDFPKKSLEEILSESSDVDTKKASVEILQWLINNVEQFIDNQMKIFKIDLVLEAESGALETMPEVRKLQNLYRAIPDDMLSLKDDTLTSRILRTKNFDQIKECRSVLDSASSRILDHMQSNQELLNHLFNRMAFFYELKAITNDGPLIQEQAGVVEIIKFEYEAFSVGVKVGEKSQYLIPEGFTIWVEISMKAKDQVPLTLF